MNMTREEAINALRIEGIEIGGKAKRLAEFMVALDVAQKALRPVSRDQVEKVLRGEWILDEDDGKYQCDNCKIKFPVNYNFCPYCGSAKTEKAMQKVIGKLESLEEMKND